MAFNFNDLVAEANRRRTRSGARSENYALEIDGNSYEIPYPDAQTYLAILQIPNDHLASQLELLFGNGNRRAYNELMAALKGKPVEVLSVLMESIWDFWGYQPQETSQGK